MAKTLSVEATKNVLHNIVGATNTYVFIPDDLKGSNDDNIYMRRIEEATSTLNNEELAEIVETLRAAYGNVMVALNRVQTDRGVN